MCLPLLTSPWSGSTYLSLVTLQPQPSWDNKCSAQVATSRRLSAGWMLGVCLVCAAAPVGFCAVRVMEQMWAGKKDAYEPVIRCCVRIC